MNKIRKALVAGASAAGAVLAGAVTTGGVPTDTAGWLALLGMAAAAGLSAGYATWRVPNALARR